jgi:serine/threonine-protein kinase
MLDEGGFRVMLTDFGLARALDDATLTGSGMLAGTPQFMSPEQALGKHVDHRSDIYSLGAVLYALSTGRPPIRGESTLEVLQRIGTEPPKPIIEINESYPVWFQRLVERMMAKSLDERLASADEAASLLRQSLAHVRSPHEVPLPDALQPAYQTPAWLQMLKSKAVLSCGLIAITGLLLITGWSLQHDGSGTSDKIETETVYSTAETKDFASTASGNPASRGPSNLTSGHNWETPELEAILSESERRLMQLQFELGSQPNSYGTEFPAPPLKTYSLPSKGTPKENSHD